MFADKKNVLKTCKARLRRARLLGILALAASYLCASAALAGNHGHGGGNHGGGSKSSGGTPSITSKSISTKSFQPQNFTPKFSKSIGSINSNPGAGNALGSSVKKLDTPKKLGTIKSFDRPLTGKFTPQGSSILGKAGHAGHAQSLGKSLDGKANFLKHHDFSPSMSKLISGTTGKKVQLDKQFDLAKKGDVARQLNLHKYLIDRGWQNRFCGPVHAKYTSFCFGNQYCGPGFFPNYCWYPRWCGWVDWCWNYRPACCYDPCDPWVYYSYPVWRPLPVVTCGTWVDVQPVAVATGLDLQMLAVRFVDPGHPEKNLGPRYRVWLRNNSQAAVNSPFAVHLLAATGNDAAANAPNAGVTVKSIDAKATMTVDIRLPVEANAMTRNEKGQTAPFTTLHAIVDSGRTIGETDEANNGAVVARRDVLPVDPALFDAEKKQLAAGQTISLAGEGLGPEAGQVVVNIGGVELQGEVEGWYDMGVRVKLPTLPLSGPTEASMIVVRGDGAASNPLTVQLAAIESSATAIQPATP